MAQISDIEVIKKVIAGEVSAPVGIAAVVNRGEKRFTADEALLLDYKQCVLPDKENSVAELGRDILAFSNTEGGLLILGVDDDRSIVGHEKVDFRRLRDSLGPFIGTRVDFDLEEVPISISGNPLRLIVIVVRRSLTAYPSQLRRDIELRPGLARKVKYAKGTLFYRLGDVTRAEPPFGDIESRARELGFSGAAPRTRTSFILEEDRPGLRLYAGINDKFYGREPEIEELITKFNDPRGRGVSIAGFGGVGKTELAIKLVAELHRRGTFQMIYSGSAKQTLLGPSGAQRTDPVFIDLPTFLDDLSGWLGLDLPKMPLGDLEAICLAELKKHKKVLLFLDNLETVNDRALLGFLDDKLPPNCWLAVTARVHKIRSFVYPKELREMEEEDAARLLRHELKRQGLDDLAATPIADLRNKVRGLFCHPLAVRWFAWACRSNPALWSTGIGSVDRRELETFCVAHTLGTLEPQAQRILGAILATAGACDATNECIRITSGVPESTVERALWDLECSGMVRVVTDEDGVTTFAIAPMAERPAAELARKNGWESEYVRNLRSFVELQRQETRETTDSPLIRDLLSMQAGRTQDYTTQEKEELIARIDRALPRCPQEHMLKLKHLKAECHRHLDSPISADDLYRECADSILAQGPVKTFEIDKIRILLEAATVAKARAQTESQIRRAISYLQAVEHTQFAHLRVLGMLTEFHAILGDYPNYQKYLRFVTSYRESSGYIRDSHLDQLEEALARAKGYFERRPPKTRVN